MKRKIVLKLKIMVLQFDKLTSLSSCKNAKIFSTRHLRFITGLMCGLLNTILLLLLLFQVMFISCWRYQFSSFSISNLSFTTTIITVCLINSTIVFFWSGHEVDPIITIYNSRSNALTRYCCGDSLLAPTSPRCF